ncbi:Peptidase S1 domain-containing protein [Sergentomyia squamirostris]
MKIVLISFLILGLMLGFVRSQASPLNQHPAHAALTFPAGRFCDATILNNRHVLTAAACGLDLFNNQRLNPNVYSLFVGMLNVPTAGGIPISHIYIHEHYNPFDVHWNNIAVFRTAIDIPLNPIAPGTIIQPVVMHNRIMPDNAVCFLVGWNSAPQHLTTPLQRQQQNIFNRAACNVLPIIAGTLTDSNICAGAVANNPNPCPNHPGGALYCLVEGTDRLVAIMSHNRRCGQNNAPGVYTQLRFYQDWIARQLIRTDATPPGPTPPPGHPGFGTVANKTLILPNKILSYLNDRIWVRDAFIESIVCCVVENPCGSCR